MINSFQLHTGIFYVLFLCFLADSNDFENTRGCKAADRFKERPSSTLEDIDKDHEVLAFPDAHNQHIWFVI